MDILEKISIAECASCECNTKTPDTEYHYKFCRYKILKEAAEEIELLRRKLGKYTDECN